MTHSAKSLAVSLLALLQLTPAAACIWPSTHNNYLYSIYDSQEFQNRAENTCEDNWKAYLGLPADDYFYFQADQVAAAARKKGDQLMASYAEQLSRYLECAGSVRYEQWEYPTKQQLAQRRQTLRQVKAYAMGKLSTRLRSQHALLLMRCNMLMGLHAENVAFWEQTASRYIETVYKDMMHDIYAGALLHTGRSDEAGQIFASLGDWQSLMTQYYRRRSFQAISEEYSRDPNSAVLPFLLQDFVNNAQEAVDEYEDGWGSAQGKLFVRDIQRQEAMQMCRLARQAAAEGKSRQPVMWQAALAWLEYLFEEKDKAQADIAKTADMDGTQAMKDCARILRLYISAGKAEAATPAYDAYIARELQWLDTLARGDEKYFGMKDRIVHQQLAPRYDRSGRHNTSLALLHSVDAVCYYDEVDTMSVAALKSLIAYYKSPGKSALDTYVAPGLELNDTTMNDLLGTKHLRLCQWEEAQRWLRMVPLDFYNARGYAVYASHRSWTVEPWLKRQWLKADMEYGKNPKPLTDNPKLAFARQMQQMEQEAASLTGTKRQQRCYDLAVRYAQAAFTGDCWFIMRDGKSAGDTVRTNETDLQAKARELLRQAAVSTDASLRERALFALAYGGLYDERQLWKEEEWNEELVKFVPKPLPHTLQYQAFAALARFEAAAQQSDYVSRCDEYRTFRQHR